MKTYLFASLCLFASFAVQAQMPPPEEIMKDNDANMDGKITREEAAKTPLANFFDLLDTNKDGVITLQELKNAKPPG